MMSQVGRPIPRNACRCGFTAVELLFVLTVMALVLSMSAPSVLGSMRENSVSSARNAVENASRTARNLAQNASTFALANNSSIDYSKFYGVVIVDDARPGEPSYAAVTHGSTATVADILADPSDPSKPLFKVEFNKNVAIYSGTDHASSSRLDANASDTTGVGLGWMFQYGNGLLTLDGSQSLKPSFVGLDTSAGSAFESSTFTTSMIEQKINALSLRTIDQQQQVGITIFSNGMVNAEDLQ